MLDPDEQVLARQRFENDRDGHRALRKFGQTWADRTWAVEGARGVGLGLAQRLAAEGETVLNVPAKLSARVRALGGGSGRKTDDTDAYAVAVAGLRARGLQLVHVDDTVAVLRLLSERRAQLVEQRIMTVNRLHQLLQDLVPGGAARRLTSKKARLILSEIRPRDQVGKARKQLALEQLADIVEVDAKLKAAAKRIAEVFKDHPSHVTDIFGFGQVLACLAIGEAGDVRRFPNKSHFASYTGTAGRLVFGRQPARLRQHRRQPAPEPCAAHRCARPDPTRRPGADLLLAQARRGQDAPGSDPVPRAPAVRQPLPRARRGPQRPSW